MTINKPLLKITAKHKLTGQVVYMEFKSIKQAKFFNPDFVEFRNLGFSDKEQHRLKKYN